MTTLTDFLLARIAEDEERAREFVQYEDDVYETAGWLSPTRVLAECDAKRRIVELAVAADEAMDPPTTLILADEVLLALAHVYADHPDFDPAWAISE